MSDREGESMTIVAIIIINRYPEELDLGSVKGKGIVEEVLEICAVIITFKITSSSVK